MRRVCPGTLVHHEQSGNDGATMSKQSGNIRANSQGTYEQTVRERWRNERDELVPTRGLHLPTSQHNASTFCDIHRVHDFP